MGANQRELEPWNTVAKVLMALEAFTRHQLVKSQQTEKT
jgi:hypothetical protein